MYYKKLPLRAGIGFKPQHFDALMQNPKCVGFIEIHAENYMVEGGAQLFQLEQLCEVLPLSLHGVGLSIGAESNLDKVHLKNLKSLIERFKPKQFSEHLAWSTHDETYLNDLLPVAYNIDTLERVCAHVNEVQHILGVQMLLENPSTYVRFADDSLFETDFIAQVAHRTGCGLLLDVSNIIVSSNNHGYDPVEYLQKFPTQYVGEIHLGGYDAFDERDGGQLYIDAHGSEISNPTWDLYQKAIEQTGAVATLIEWDNNVPSFEVLLAEAQKADLVLQNKTQAKVA